MTDHTDPVDMVRESLREYVALAKLGISHEKSASGNVLGFAAAELLFRIVDVIGGYCADEEVDVRDGARQRIGLEAQGFLVLNHPYFEYNFSKSEIARISKQARNALTHTALLGVGVRLAKDRGIAFGIEFSADGWLNISLPELADRFEVAVERFLANAESHLANPRMFEDEYFRANADKFEAIRKSFETHGAPESATVTARGPDRDFEIRLRKWRGART